METPREEKVVYKVFFWSILLKGAISVFEVIAGSALFFIPSATIIGLALTVLNYIPDSGIQNKLIQEVATYTSGTVIFVAFYLLSRGLIKVLLIGALLKNKVWAYPASLFVLFALVLYQIGQIYSHHSPIVIAITLFDIFVMYFIYLEWKIVEKHVAQKNSTVTL